MGKKKNAYTEMCAAIASHVKEKKTTIHSSSDYVGLTQALMNTPEHTQEIYVRNGDNEPIVKEKNPSVRYREALKGVVKQFGIDKNELGKLDDMQFSKEHAAAVADLSTTVLKDYIGTGRKFTMPITSAHESQMSIAQTTVPKKSVATNKIVQGPDGNYSSVPTGKTVTTEEHDVIKASNKVPGWLKSEK